jgi:hypothetical protein
MNSFLRALLIIVLFASSAAAARAHDLRMTAVKIRIDGSATYVSVRAHGHTLGSTNAATALGNRLRLRLDSRPFEPGNIRVSRDTANGIVIWQAAQAGAAATVSVDAPLFPEREGETTVVSLIKDRQISQEAVLDASSGGVTLGAAPDAGAKWAVALRFLCSGVEHIFLGPDHVLFVLSLLLLGGTAMQLLKVVTAFTLAHSVTLSLAATETFSLSPRFVEPVIALSIVAVAAVNMTRTRADASDVARRTDFRPWLAFGFGLMHGFGFAGALTEVGLPREALAWALVSFNAGVEVGQVAIVLAVAPALAMLVKARPRLRTPVVYYGSASVAMVGAFWFSQRLFSL